MNLKTLSGKILALNYEADPPKDIHVTVGRKHTERRKCEGSYLYLLFQMIMFYRQQAGR